MKNIPSKERVWVRYKDGGETKFVITSNLDRSLYYIYGYDGSEYTKISKSKTPTDFDKIINSSKK